MSNFKLVPDGLVVLMTKGTYIEAKVYVYRNYLYAKKGASYIKLMTGSGTSVQGIAYRDLSPHINYVNNGSYLQYVGELK